MHRRDTGTSRRTWAVRAALPLVAAAAVTAALLPGSGSARALTPPANTAEPRITGETVEGRTLTANPGSWSGTTPMLFNYRWLRCPTDGGAPDGSNCAAIQGATSGTYRLRDADVGLRMRVQVTARNIDGSATATSNPTSVVRGSARPRNVDPPVISGPTVVGQTLTGSLGTWSGSQPISYSGAWLRCNRTGSGCAAIPGAGGRTYKLMAGDVGATLRVRVTARNSVGSTTATSVPTGVVASGAPSGCPAGTGPIVVDQLNPPARLSIDRQQVLPNPVPRNASGLLVRFHVSACGGRSVAGATVYVTGVPYNQFTIPPEQQTGGDGWVTMQMQRLSGFPAADRQTLLVMFVRARKAGEPLLGGISTRRLVSFRLNR